jgi:hypothetical protein
MRPTCTPTPGRHATTHRELVRLPSGAVVIDTPGLRAVALAGTEEGLARAVADVEDLAAPCRFAGEKVRWKACTGPGAGRGSAPGDRRTARARRP